MSSRASKRRIVFPDSHRRDAQQLYNELWGKSTDATHFIAPTPVSLERTHLGRLTETHLVTEKSDGERHMLLVGIPPGDDDAYVVLVPRNRRLKHTGTLPGVSSQVRLPFSPEVDADLGEGTLLDGELMPDGSFRVFDAVCIGGYDLKTYDFEGRLRLATPAVECLSRILPCSVKRFYPVSEATKVLNDAKGPCDGLIFMPKACPVRTGRHSTCFKWKAVSHCSVDLEWDGNKFVAIDDAGQKVQPALRIRVPEHQLLDSAIYEIFPPTTNKISDYWQVGPARSDKLYPNNTTTVEHTLRTIQDRVRVSEIR